jgi:uncharacterized phage infection (PIP) family protein YhgE
MAKQVSSKNLKAEILEAYDELYEEHERMRAEQARLLKEKQALEKRTAQPPSPVQVAAEPTAEAEQPRTLDAILNSLATLRAGFGSAISELSAQLTAEATKLRELQGEISDRVNQLTKLYDLTVTESTLDDLIQEYQQKVESFERETREKRQAFEQDMAARREAWKREQEEHRREIKERDGQLEKKRRREIEEYQYDLQIQRALEAEQYEQKIAAQRRELDAMVEAKEQEWSARERGLAEREQEYRDLETRVQGFPDELEAAIKRATKEGAEAARKEAKIRDDLLAKEEEGDRRVAEQKIASLEQTIDEQAKQIEALSTQLAAVVEQSQALAIRAIEGASHETSFESIREIALEQAKRPPKAE